MKKPKVDAISDNDPIFFVMAAASLALKKENKKEHAEKMRKRLRFTQSNDEAMRIIQEYVEII